MVTLDKTGLKRCQTVVDDPRAKTPDLNQHHAYQYCVYSGVDNSPNKPVSPEIAPGQGQASIDATSEADRALVRQAITRWPKRWAGLDDTFKRQVVKDLSMASDHARTLDDPQATAQILVSVAKTAVMMEGQHLADEHRQDANEREDAGKGPQAVQLIQVNWVTPAQLAKGDNADD